MNVGEGLLTRTIEVIARTAKSVVEEVEKRMGRPVKVRARSKERGARAAAIVSSLLVRRREDGLVPFPSARTRTVLKALRVTEPRQVKGLR